MTEFKDEYQKPQVTAYDRRRPSMAPTEASAVIENPLQKFTTHQVKDNVRQFCAEKGLSEHEDMFVKGALVARDPDDFHDIPDLSPTDKEVFQYEKDHKWWGPRMLYFAIGVCAVGAATQGWDQTGSNGANLSFPTEFGIGASLDSGGPNAKHDTWLVGLVNSAPYASAAVAGVWLSDPLNHYFGRRGEIFITAIVLIVTPIASGFTHSWQQLFVVRLILGLGLGAKAATVPVYAAEMAPTRIRGALTMGWQLWTCLGIFLGFAANCVVKDTGRIAWRLQLGSAFVPAVPLALFIWFSPESPRWLMKKNRYPKAFRSMCRLRSHPMIAARDLYYSHVLYENELKEARGANYITRLVDCFRVPRIRRANLAASTVMLAQQMCGINIISFYSSTVFVEANMSATNALYASLGFGALNFVFAIPAVFLIDTFGRRSLLLSTFPLMAIFLLATGLSFLVPEEQVKLRLGLVATFIYMFTIFYSVGEGPVAFMYSAEVFPNIQREQGMAWAVCVNNFFASILGLTFPIMELAMGHIGAFCFYAGLNVVAFVWIFLWVPETKNLTLEELDSVFSMKTGRYMQYQTGTWLPWFFRRYLFCDKRAHLKPLIEKSHLEKTASPSDSDVHIAPSKADL